jgi:hypothetical protein
MILRARVRTRANYFCSANRSPGDWCDCARLSLCGTRVRARACRRWITAAPASRGSGTLWLAARTLIQLQTWKVLKTFQVSGETWIPSSF